ncbi:PAS domain S-box protein [Mucilaginibacter limnophilus]|uniref:histidine kinase n=1 Tax=Mucilaginibacter limnophilus TaxID=1932778 RepID=A0A3S2UJN3_9SPHI|nr:PAS domain S-box protein [Mucilaginibacter limnophilus]RVT98505.1 PAS domain S-box protein [Mucilaginibacter limnophilus]
MTNLTEENKVLKEELERLKLQIEQTAIYQAEKDQFHLEYEKSQHRFRTIFEESSVGKKIIDDQLKIIKVNKSLTRIIGYNQEELIGKRITDFAHPDHARQWKALQKELWTTELTSFNFDSCLIKKDGSAIWLHVTTIIIEDNGNRLGYTILEDISERKELERIQVLVREQEQRQQIAETVLNTQEEERRRVAERLHNGLGQLLYGVKLSLNRVEVNTDNNREAIKYTEQLITDCIVECRGISHDLMPAMLAEDGLKEAVVDICRQLTGTVKFEYRLLGLKPRLPEFLEVAIYRMIQELLMNIVKHADATLASIHILAGEKLVNITVKDNGKGFNQARLENNGIGLHTIRTKTEFLSGKLNITSAEGQGTTITITIPKRVD